MYVFKGHVIINLSSTMAKNAPYSAGLYQYIVSKQAMYLVICNIEIQVKTEQDMNLVQFVGECTVDPLKCGHPEIKTACTYNQDTQACPSVILYYSIPKIRSPHYSGRFLWVPKVSAYRGSTVVIIAILTCIKSLSNYN